MLESFSSEDLKWIWDEARKKSIDEVMRDFTAMRAAQYIQETKEMRQELTEGYEDLSLEALLALWEKAGEASADEAQETLLAALAVRFGYGGKETETELTDQYQSMVDSDPSETADLIRRAQMAVLADIISSEYPVGFHAWKLDHESGTLVRPLKDYIWAEMDFVTWSFACIPTDILYFLWEYIRFQEELQEQCNEIQEELSGREFLMLSTMEDCAWLRGDADLIPRYVCSLFDGIYWNGDRLFLRFFASGKVVADRFASLETARRTLTADYCVGYDFENGYFQLSGNNLYVKLIYDGEYGYGHEEEYWGILEEDGTIHIDQESHSKLYGNKKAGWRMNPCFPRTREDIADQYEAMLLDRESRNQPLSFYRYEGYLQTHYPFGFFAWNKARSDYLRNAPPMRPVCCPWHLQDYLREGDFQKPEYADVPDQVLLYVAEAAWELSRDFLPQLMEELLRRFPEARAWYVENPNLSPTCLRPLVLGLPLAEKADGKP